MMRIPVLKGLLHGLAQAVHLCLASPIPCRQRVGVPVMIVCFERRHVEKIHAAHEFAPAQNLPYETLYTG